MPTHLPRIRGAGSEKKSRFLTIVAHRTVVVIVILDGRVLGDWIFHGRANRVSETLVVRGTSIRRPGKVVLLHEEIAVSLLLGVGLALFQSILHTDSLSQRNLVVWRLYEIAVRIAHVGRHARFFFIVVSFFFVAP